MTRLDGISTGADVMLGIIYGLGLLTAGAAMALVWVIVATLCGCLLRKKGDGE